jgi:hypothetical protein
MNLQYYVLLPPCKGKALTDNYSINTYLCNPKKYKSYINSCHKNYALVE